VVSNSNRPVDSGLDAGSGFDGVAGGRDPILVVFDLSERQNRSFAPFVFEQ
jgi:hypothetical protein